MILNKGSMTKSTIGMAVAGCAPGRERGRTLFRHWWRGNKCPARSAGPSKSGFRHERRKIVRDDRENGG